MNQEFRLQNIDETRNYFLEEIKQNELMILDVFQFLLLFFWLVFL